ncbi:MAG: acylphosphatase [Candidatus Omnitrophica bacterium]|nr:acylphosphatase [Candidatus Omnitrophota bacterium]
MNKRLHVYYSGRVQGVGFRFTAERLATDLGLGGWVKNLADGRVELICEGKQERLEKVLAKIDHEFSDYIRQKDVSWMDGTGEFDNFQVRFF